MVLTLAAADTVSCSRFSQFRWLHQMLAEKYPGVPRPSLPPKLKVGGLDPRRASLEKYMNALVLEPSFLLSTELFIFLTATEEALAQAMASPPLPFLQRGWEEFNKNNAEKASVWFGQALQAYIKRTDITGQFQSLRFLGEVCQFQQRWSSGAKTYRQLLKVAQQMEDHEGAAIALINMARCCHQLSDYNTAVSCLTEMFESAGKMGQVHLQAVALRNIGMVHASLYDYGKAIANFREELQLRQQLDDTEEAMKASEAVGLMLFRMYDVQGAIKTFSDYLTMAEQCNGLVYKGLALLGLGTFYDYLGDNETSIGYLRNSRSIFESLTDEQNITVVLNNIGIYYRRVCDFNSAEKNFRHAYHIAKDNGDMEMQTRCLRNLALVKNQMDDFSSSVNLIAESVRLAEKVNDRRLLTQAYRTQADIFMLLNNLEDAHKLFTICEGMCNGTEDKVEHARCLCGLAELAANKLTPDNAKALSYFQQALQISTGVDYKKGMALANYGAGLIYRRLGDFVRATETLQQSTDIFDTLQNSRMHCRSLAQLALCKCYEGSYAEAMPLLQQAKDTAELVRDKNGVTMATDAEDAVQRLENLLVRHESFTVKAQRQIASTGSTVGVLVTISATELRVAGDGKKAASKHRPEEVETSLPIGSEMMVELDRTPKRLIIVRCPGHPDLELSCAQRSLLNTALKVLTMRVKACSGLSSASGTCLTSMQVGSPAEFIVTAKVASGEQRIMGGDPFVATLTRKAPLPAEPVYKAVVQESVDLGGAPVPGQEHASRSTGLGIGEAYDISEESGRIIIAEDVDAINTDGATASQRASMPATSASSVVKDTAVSGSTKAEAAITDNGDGTYTCVIVPTFSGQCSLDVSLDGVPIQGSPFLPEILPAELCPEKCEIPDGDVAVLGGTTSRMLYAKDQHGNQLLAGGASVKVVYRSTAGQKVLAVTDRGNGTYAFEYDAGASGSGQLVAWVNGTELDSNPIAVSATHAPMVTTVNGTADIASTIAQSTASVALVISTPSTFAQSEFAVGQVLSEARGWGVSETEQFASALSADLHTLNERVQTHTKNGVATIATCMAALQAGGPDEALAPLPTEWPLRLEQAQQAYDAAQQGVKDAVTSGLWHIVAQRVEQRSQTRNLYIGALTEAVQLDLSSSSSPAGPGDVGPLAKLLASVPPLYGATTGAAATNAADAVVAYNLWQSEASHACLMALLNFNSHCAAAQKSISSINALWSSLLPSGNESVQALVASLAPMAAALQTAQQAMPQGLRADDFDDEDASQDDSPRAAGAASSPSAGMMQPHVTAPITQQLPNALAQCDVLRNWAGAVQEVTAQQTDHAALCAGWANSAQLLSRQLRQLIDGGRDVGADLVFCARQLVAGTAPADVHPWTKEQAAALDQMKQLAALELQIPNLEMEFHMLNTQQSAEQQQQAPALVQRLQQAYELGFVELQSTLTSAQGLPHKD
jgi:tetratricopeptide (TPR) repeat protein